MTAPARHRARRQRRSFRPLLVLAPLAGAVIVAAVVTPSSRNHDEAGAGSQVARALGATPTAVSASQACEDAVLKALTRYAMAPHSGVDGDLLIGQEQQRLSSIEYDAYSRVLNDFAMAIGDPRNQDGLATITTRFLPSIRRTCSQAH